MTNVIYYLATGAESLPLESGNSILLPKMYDIVWSIIPLVVILFLLGKLVLPKYMELLTEREDRIQGGIKRAETAEAEAQAVLEKYNARLLEARNEAAEIREQARARGKEIEAEAREQAAAESQRIIEAGEKQLQASRQQVVTELRQEMGQNSISLAERILGSELTAASKRAETIDAFLAELDATMPAGK
ncbi:F0F1 ATP synthase subunit B [Corynebacterium caspium]|uniref:F0F1 ATP synthase subunit B n=1 Tax=Corynebacterium caspium TaxID=234828 RepID=UPI0004754611|nr:F0F1 ATP synthase subunit B [Corynebacterium caspium]WKD59450.1 ATP synthase subunit b [Corynebacterium caspium DSM 44850]